MRSVWLFTAAAMLAGAAHAAPLTYDAALKLADQSAPSLQAKALDVGAAQSASVAAGRLPDAKVAVGVEGFPISGPNAGPPERDDFSDVRVGFIQDVPNGPKRQAARDRARADIGAAQAGLVVEARTVRVGAALAWIDLYYARRKLAALDVVEVALLPLRDTAPAQLASGAQRPAQTLEADQMIAALGDRRADLTAAAGKAKAELFRWTGDAEAEVAGAPPDYDLDPTALRAGLDRIPALRAYEATGRQADADVAAARADKRPDWSWEVAYPHRDPRFGDMVMAQATVSLPLFASTRQDPMIAARTQTANRVRIEREAARRATAASLEADLADHVMHHDRLARAETTLVPLATRRADLETASYAAGSATLSEALNATLALAEARIDTLDREADVARDGVRIALTYGSDAP
jgi:cobalt-zinc-cadmium efflux system outer membrane protein